MTTVTHIAVFPPDYLDDPGMLDALERVAVGELRLHATRNDAALSGEPSRTAVNLYRVPDVDEAGRPCTRLETGRWLELIGEPVAARPDAVLIRWEQTTQRRVWPQPRKRR